MHVDLAKEVDVGSLIKFAAILVSVVAAFVWVQTDVQNLKQEQARMEQRQSDIRVEMRTDYITREQLDYIVIQRLDRLEEKIDAQFEALQKSLNQE